MHLLNYEATKSEGPNIIRDLAVSLLLP